MKRFETGNGNTYNLAALIEGLDRVECVCTIDLDVIRATREILETLCADGPAGDAVRLPMDDERHKIDIMLAGEGGKGLQEPDVIDIWVDGGCHNNGTPEAEAYYTTMVEGAPPYTSAVPANLPQTNNVAEYKAVEAALHWALWNLDRGAKAVIHTDSRLIVGQLTQGWKIKKPHLRVLHAGCRKLMDELGADVVLAWEHRETIVAKVSH